jgi:tetratricopeptide (TPR) repeat protein
MRRRKKTLAILAALTVLNVVTFGNISCSRSGSENFSTPMSADKQTSDDLQALRDLGDSYAQMGVLSEAEGSRDEAREYYERFLEIAKNLVSRAPDDLQALHALSFGYNRLGVLSSAEGRS